MKPERIAYFDCSCGASGDMALGALLDAGLDADVLAKAVRGLKIGRVAIKTSRTTRNGIGGTKADVVPAKKCSQHRRLDDILEILAGGRISPDAKKKCVAVFKALAAAEARVHRMPVKKVHFHEVGAVDTIVDIVGVVVGLEALEIDRVVCSPLSIGTGTVECAHGILPVPAPATAELLKGLPVRHIDEGREMTTPTGAALMKVLSENFGTMPRMRLDAVGSGAGLADPKDKTKRPNLLRVFIGEVAADEGYDEVVILSANIDDATPESCAYALERMMAAGARDAWATPIVMKKGRAAWELRAMCDEERAEPLAEIFFRETGTLGLRLERVKRRTLERKTEKVGTRWGEVRVKVGLLEGEGIGAKPEFDDCRKIAEKNGVALRDVFEDALRRRPRKKRRSE